jgi:hypothetical protein
MGRAPSNYQPATGRRERGPPAELDVALHLPPRQRPRLMEELDAALAMPVAGERAARGVQRRLELHEHVQLHWWSPPPNRGRRREQGRPPTRIEGGGGERPELELLAAASRSPSAFASPRAQSLRLRLAPVATTRDERPGLARSGGWPAAVATCTAELRPCPCSRESATAPRGGGGFAGGQPSATTERRGRGHQRCASSEQRSLTPLAAAVRSAGRPGAADASSTACASEGGGWKMHGPSARPCSEPRLGSIRAASPMPQLPPWPPPSCRRAEERPIEGGRQRSRGRRRRGSSGEEEEPIAALQRSSRHGDKKYNNV